jgi:hypothetical protein
MWLYSAFDVLAVFRLQLRQRVVPRCVRCDTAVVKSAPQQPSTTPSSFIDLSMLSFKIHSFNQGSFVRSPFHSREKYMAVPSRDLEPQAYTRSRDSKGQYNRCLVWRKRIQPGVENMGRQC